MSDLPPQLNELPISDEMQDSYLRYAMSVIMARALPDVRDGLKPSQRRILVTMNDLNLGPRAQHRKCAKIAGDTSGNYHPHGEGVVYPTLVRMAQAFNMRYPLVDGQGNFGSIDGDPPAAMRYTEARMTAAATEMLADLNLETVDFVENYDGTRQEPVVLPSRFPNLLVNGSIGIAVGMACSLPPHNLREMCDGLIAVLDNPDITITELMRIIPGPDFPTGGILCGQQGVREAYETGRGNVVVRAKYHVEETRTGRAQIVFDEIPYNILRSTITERVVACIREGRLPDVSNYNDESDRKHAIRLVFELRKDVNVDVVVNQLFEFTPLQSNFNIINIALVHRQPRTLGLKDLMRCYLEHRGEVIRRRTRFLLRKARQRAHLLEGLILAVGDIDAIIEMIKSSPDPAAAKQRLCARPLRLSEDQTLRRLLPDGFLQRMAAQPQNLTGVQADEILKMQLQRLTGLEIEKLAKEYAKLMDDIAGYQALLASDEKVREVIRGDLREMRDKYGDDRRTEIGTPVGEFRMEELIAREQMIVTISHDGYIKRVAIDTYRTQGRGGRGLRGSDTKEGDFLEHLFVASTHDFLLFFTNRGRVYWLKVYDIPEMARTARGRSIANLIKLGDNERHMAVLPVAAFEEKYVFFGTSKGRVKKTALGAYSNPRPSGIIAISLDPDDELVNVELTGGDDEVVIATRNGMAVRFSEHDVRAMGRSAAGVKGIELKSGDGVVDMCVARPGMSLLTICENGYGKRTDMEEYRLQKRGGSGVINIRTTERNGSVVALRAVTDTDELMITTAAGIMLRTKVADTREIGRATQGVKMIRLDEGDKVVAVARIAQEEGEGGAGAAAEDAGGSDGSAGEGAQEPA
ncbi:MAG: DNA gyrase subunit A [Phycisphaerae bacterium]|nr:DNA gyrase subunit A [Phycisphaerae bacterium]NUQ46506.1 DNA gyrase subunit A [Phycisphaerae bacterium]